MSDNVKTNEDWGKITAIAILLSLIVGLLIFYFLGSIALSIASPVLLFGLFELGSSFLKSREPDQFGTSESFAATFWGFVFIAVGIALLMFLYTGNLIFTAVVVLLIMVVYLIMRYIQR